MNDVAFARSLDALMGSAAVIEDDERGVVVHVPVGILFEADTTNVAPDARDWVDALVNAAAADPERIVRIEPDRVVTTTDLLLSRGPWEGEDLAVWAAYGAPGIPLGVESAVCATPSGHFVAPDDAALACIVDVPPGPM